MLGPPQDVSYPTLSPYRLSGRAVGHLKQVHSTCGLWTDTQAVRERAASVLLIRWARRSFIRMRRRFRCITIVYCVAVDTLAGETAPGEELLAAIGSHNLSICAWGGTDDLGSYAAVEE